MLQLQKPFLNLYQLKKKHCTFFDLIIVYIIMLISRKFLFITYAHSTGYLSDSFNLYAHAELTLRKKSPPAGRVMRCEPGSILRGTPSLYH